MSKIYYGKKGAGKTVKLLLDAEARVNEGVQPVFITPTRKESERLKKQVRQLNLSYDKMLFLAYKQFKDPAISSSFISSPAPFNFKGKYKVYIDELEYLLKTLLNNADFTATIDTEFFMPEVKREDWDKNYNKGN